MKRDWNTIREILMQLESLESVMDKLHLADFPEEDSFKISYHFGLLIDAHLVNGDKSDTQEIIKEHTLNSLTWEGHEFLDTIRKDSVWEKTKSTIKETGSSMTFDIVKSVATGFVTTYLQSGNS